MDLDFTRVLLNMLIDIFKPFWYWIVIAVLLKLFIDVILPDLLKDWKFKKIFKWTQGQDKLKELRKLSPSEFEIFTVNLFEKFGYYATHNGKTGDHGIDVILEKDGKRTYVQCKKYGLKHKVGEPEIRNFLGALVDKTIETNGLFITTGFFTIAAQKFAEDKPIELIDGFALLNYIRDAEAISNNKKSNIAKACPLCKNGKLVVKIGKYGNFMGCSNFPQCKYTKNV